MFLARGGMPLEDLWEQWFRSVVNLIPVHSLRQQLCDSHDIAYLHGLECPAFNPNVRHHTPCWEPLYSYNTPQLVQSLIFLPPAALP